MSYEANFKKQFQFEFFYKSLGIIKYLRLRVIIYIGNENKITG